MNALGQIALKFAVAVATTVAVHYTSKVIIKAIDNASKEKSTLDDIPMAKSGRG